MVPSLDRQLSDARQRTAFAAPQDPIFATRHGTHQDSHNLRQRLRPAAQAAGVPWMTPHVLRHSLATELVDRGYDISAIAKVLGHRSEAFNRRVYVHSRETPRFDELDPTQEVGYLGSWPRCPEPAQLPTRDASPPGARPGRWTTAAVWGSPMLSSMGLAIRSIVVVARSTASMSASCD
jgi:hypothetical protein